MTTDIDLTTMTTEELQALRDRVTAALAARQSTPTPALRQIICRTRNINSRRRGTQVSRRLRLPDGTTGWASDIAQDVTGDWPAPGSRAAERKAVQRGRVPIGTIVLEYETPIDGGRKSRATITAGIVVGGGDATTPIEWGLSTRRRGEAVEVQTTEAGWVTI